MPGTGDSIQRGLRRRAEQIRKESPGQSVAPDQASPTRRTFLAGAMAAGAGLALAGSTAGAAAAGPGPSPVSIHSTDERHGPKVVIVGAGLAGLTCAYRLQQRGVRAQVFEARHDRLGAAAGRLAVSATARSLSTAGSSSIPDTSRSARIVRELGLTLEDREAASGSSGSVTPIWLRGRLRGEDEVYIAAILVRGLDPATASGSEQAVDRTFGHQSGRLRPS